MFKIDFSNIYNIDHHKIDEVIKEKHLDLINRKYCEGNYVGWLNYATEKKDEIEKAIEVGKGLRKYETVVVIGIGGSYLGTKAIYDALNERNCSDCPELVFLGNNLSGHYIEKTLKYLENKNFACNVISKSGGTLETAIAFRLVTKLMREKYGLSFKDRLVITTDPRNGILKNFADNLGLETLSIPKDIGGRYSIFTPVGIVPLEAAGIDMSLFLKGVRGGERDFSGVDLTNKAYEYGLYRYLLNKNGHKVEIFTVYDESLKSFQEWLKQLLGESEGKDSKGIYPMSVVNTTDLHSMGQFIQEGTKNHFETIIWFEEDRGLLVNNDPNNFAGLNYLADKSLDLINKKAMEGTRKAHYKGGISNILIEVSELKEETLGYLVYFFMRACGMSCLLSEVEPFNQPGVEAYKKEVKNLLEVFDENK